MFSSYLPGPAGQGSRFEAEWGSQQLEIMRSFSPKARLGVRGADPLAGCPLPAAPVPALWWEEGGCSKEALHSL